MSFSRQGYAALRICWFNGILPLWRTPTMMASVVLTPASFLFFLFVVERATTPALLPFGILGGILFMVLFTGNGMLNDCAYLRLERQLQSVFVASPVRSATYLIGMALSELAFALPALVIFFVLLEVAHPVGAATLAALLVVVLLTWIMASTLGFLISTFFRQMREIWPIATLVFSTLSVLPPVFYPIGLIPASWQWASFLVPSTFAAQLGSHLLHLSFGASVTPGWLGSPWTDLVGLLGVTALFGLLALRLARWREP
jgi:ABC-2 type transport system permease protein